ncbi:MAG: GyrI-like domain-containing protein [Parcubacteria group bacterium]
MRKIDYKKDFKQLYLPPTKPVTVKVPKMNYLMVDGEGSPESKKHTTPFQQAIQALYSIAYTVKFTLKFARVGPEYTVPPLDGLWWMKGGKNDFDLKRPNDWRWRLMIVQPNHVTKRHIVDAIKLIRERAKKKKQPPSPRLDDVVLKPFAEGLCVQIMHIGPYDKEKPSIEKLLIFVKEKGYKIAGLHHEIYLSDPRRVVPSKLRTVLRHQVKKTRINN